RDAFHVKQQQAGRRRLAPDQGERIVEPRAAEAPQAVSDGEDRSVAHDKRAAGIEPQVHLDAVKTGKASRIETFQLFAVAEHSMGYQAHPFIAAFA
ncbi:MAG: hypothetical protein ACK4WC_15265, partial [Rubrimonas sp.]